MKRAFCLGLLDDIPGASCCRRRRIFPHQSHPQAGKTLSAEHTLAKRFLPGNESKTVENRRINRLNPENCTRPVALTIAGFDPGSGAGITADLKTFAAHGVYGVACISAMTVQSTLGVRAVEPLSASLVRATLECLVEDVALSGVKIGMLGSSAVAAEVASFLRAQSSKISRERIVLDPVLGSTSGTPLIDANGVRIIRDELLHCVGWVTPNIHELAILIGDDLETLSRDQVPAAAARLREGKSGVERGRHWRTFGSAGRLPAHRVWGRALANRGKDRHQLDPRYRLRFLNRNPLRASVRTESERGGCIRQGICDRSTPFSVSGWQRQRAHEPPVSSSTTEGA